MSKLQYRQFREIRQISRISRFQCASRFSRPLRPPEPSQPDFLLNRWRRNLTWCFGASETPSNPFCCSPKRGSQTKMGQNLDFTVVQLFRPYRRSSSGMSRRRNIRPDNTHIFDHKPDVWSHLEPKLWLFLSRNSVLRPQIKTYAKWRKRLPQNTQKWAKMDSISRITFSGWSVDQIWCGYLWKPEKRAIRISAQIWISSLGSRDMVAQSFRSGWRSFPRIFNFAQ